MDSILGKSILVEAPASIANLGPGFDILAMAVKGLSDRVKIEVREGYGDIYVNVVGDQSVPGGRKNSAYAVVEKFLDMYHVNGYDIYVTVEKDIPVSAGLGGSGATSAATAYGLVELFNVKYDKRLLLELAGVGEAHVAGAVHYDNVAASLFGGIVIVDPRTLEVYSIKPRRSFWIGVIIPEKRDKQYKTLKARSVIPSEVELKLHILQSASIAKLIHALYEGDLKVLGKAISSDYVVEPKRSILIEEYWTIKKIALSNSALGFNIAGAGPSVFFIHQSRRKTKELCVKIKEYLRQKGIDTSFFILTTSSNGVKVIGKQPLGREI